MWSYLFKRQLDANQLILYELKRMKYIHIMKIVKGWIEKGFKRPWPIGSYAQAQAAAWAVCLKKIFTKDREKGKL